MTESPREGITLGDLAVTARDEAVPVVVDAFVGIYRWHAKRTLRDVSVVRAARVDGAIVGISMLERLTPSVAYVYYLAVRKDSRRRGLGALLLDDALDGFVRGGARVVYGAAEKKNTGSIALFVSRGFRTVERRELGYQQGGLGAWGLRSRMWLVSGEVLMGRRFAPEPPGTSEGPTGPVTRGREPVSRATGSQSEDRT
ncbi:MAG: GNAT family N-acetyltransferase [Thermoplasmata archaeon]